MWKKNESLIVDRMTDTSVKIHLKVNSFFLVYLKVTIIIQQARLLSIHIFSVRIICCSVLLQSHVVFKRTRLSIFRWSTPTQRLIKTINAPRTFMSRSKVYLYFIFKINILRDRHFFIDLLGRSIFVLAFTCVRTLEYRVRMMII